MTDPQPLQAFAKTVCHVAPKPCQHLLLAPPQTKNKKAAALERTWQGTLNKWVCPPSASPFGSTPRTRGPLNQKTQIPKKPQHTARPWIGRGERGGDARPGEGVASHGRSTRPGLEVLCRCERWAQMGPETRRPTPRREKNLQLEKKSVLYSGKTTHRVK